MYFLLQFKFYQSKYLLGFVHTVSKAVGPTPGPTQVLKSDLVNGWLERGDPERLGGELGEGKSNSPRERERPHHLSSFKNVGLSST